MRATILALLLAAPALAANLDLYAIDTEGGKSLLIVSPAGQTMLIDAGYPTPNDRDTDRIVSLAQSLGIKAFDYIMPTHYDMDHAGNIPKVDSRIPGRTFVDHGELIATARDPDRSRFYPAYVENIKGRPRISVKPGDTIPLSGVKITVLTAGGAALQKAGATANPLCAGLSRPTYTDTDDNAGSIGILLEYARFRMADFGDLLGAVEYDLMCPANPVGTVDLFMVSHHGFKQSNSEVLVHSLRPRVAIMNNGPRKGGEAQVFDILKSSPGFTDLWQLHYSPAAGDKNSPESMIANMDAQCQGKAIKVSVAPDGSFTVTNTRTGFSKKY
ncbi:MAG TPA: MBL fold metallo-hydrolase [Candidatus Sulfopaludibacter sp.]|nr:MBL fold metallo-hydrolase [Candidatus Sulfopaludibacter sp.]